MTKDIKQIQEGTKGWLMNKCIWEYNTGNHCDCEGYCLAQLLLPNSEPKEENE